MNRIADSSTFSQRTSEVDFDAIEDRVRASVRATIETVFEEELAEVLGRIRYGRGRSEAKGYRHMRCDGHFTGTLGTETARVPRARIETGSGGVREWRSQALPRCRWLTGKPEALIAAVRLAGTDTRLVSRRSASRRCRQALWRPAGRSTVRLPSCPSPSCPDRPAQAAIHECAGRQLDRRAPRPAAPLIFLVRPDARLQGGPE